MGREMIKLFYGFGILVCVISLLLIRRTVVDVIPTIGMEGASFYLIMSVVFLLIGIVILLIGRSTSKKFKAEDRAKELDQQ